LRSARRPQGRPTCRRPDLAVAVDVKLAGRQFGSIKVDISPGAHELGVTETVALPNALRFAGFATVDVEIVDIQRHAAEKFHGMLQDFGDRENSRVRDLADLMLMLDAGLLDPSRGRDRREPRVG
jgi:Nucleotidyl transferase AbiEii toxin, Type IV TA system